MSAVAYDRQLGFFDPSKHPHAHVTFVGVGGIGSFASFAVAKLGVPRITLIDPDIVEPHNLPNQMFDESQVGDTKVGAAWNNIALVQPDCFLNYYVSRIEADGWAQLQEGNRLYDAPGKLRDVVVSGLDSMSARTDLWRELRLNPLVPLYIDGRLDGQQLVIYSICPWDLEDVEQYEATLLSDDEVPAGLCTERAIIDVGFTMAAQIARLVRRHFAEQEIPKITCIDMESNSIVHGGWIA